MPRPSSLDDGVGPDAPSFPPPAPILAEKPGPRSDAARPRRTRLFGRTGDGRLVLRFAITSLVALAVSLGGTLWFMTEDARRDARRDIVARAALVAMPVADLLRPGDLDGVGPDRRHDLDALFQQGVVLGDALAAEIIGPGGRLVYATTTAVIDPAARAHLAPRALAGSAISTMGHLDSAGNTPVVVAGVPLRVGGGSAPPAALLVAGDYGPVAAHTRDQITRVGIGMLVALALLWGTVLPVLVGAARRLRKQAADNEHQALRDALTGLPNRALFRDRVRHAALVSRRHEEAFVVMALDIDRFKEVNDALGQATGDELLRQVGRRLRSALRESDTVARLGGDQFGLLLPGAGGGAGPIRVAGALLDVLGEPFDLGEMSVTLEISVGAATFPAHGGDDDALIQHADVARRHAKETRSGLVMYSPGLDPDSTRRLTLAGDLRRGISDGRLVVHYQPKVHLVTGRITGLEALVRWNHPEFGMLGPGEFIPTAEATGLIRPLTLEVLDVALRQCSAWRRAGNIVDVAVNLSVQHLLDDGLPSDVSRLLVRHHLPAEALELEITEGSIMSNPRRARDVLIRLSDMGVRIAIDDFGVGYSSLGYLSQLPVDVLKIDRSFVVKMAESGHEAMIVRTTIDLAHNLGLEVVAEGVETAEVETLLREQGCDLAQGYHFSRPCLPADLDGILQERRAPVPLDANQMVPGT